MYGKKEQSGIGQVEKNTMTIFGPISLLNVERTIFSVVARRLVSYLKANCLVDIYVGETLKGP